MGTESKLTSSMPRCGLDRKTNADGRWSKARYGSGQCKCKCKPKGERMTTSQTNQHGPPTNETENTNESLSTLTLETVLRE